MIGPEARDVACSCLLLAAAVVVGVLALNLAPTFDGMLR